MINKKGYLLAFSFILFFFKNTCFGVEEEMGVKMPRKQVLPLSLRNSIYLAVKNNLDVAIVRLLPPMQAAQVQEEKAQFDPSSFFEINKGNNKIPLPQQIQRFLGGGISAGPSIADLFVEGGISRDVAEKLSRALRPPIRHFFTINDDEFGINFSSGIRGRLQSGLTYELRFTNNRSSNSFNAHQSEYTQTAEFSLTQHLLKGFGLDVNTSGIEIANNNLEISKNEFIDKISEIITRVIEAYWDLVFRIEDLKVKKKSLELAKDLLRRNKIQVEIGTMAPIEVLEAKSEVAFREEEIIKAQEELKNAEDTLRKLINIEDVPLAEDVKVIPLDKPVFKLQRVSLTECLKEAFQKRPDYVQAKLSLQNRNIQLNVAKNQLLPTIDFVGRIASNSLSGNFGNSLDGIFRGKTPSWSIGLRIEFPIRNRIAKSELIKSQLEKERAQLQLKNLEQNIILEVKRAVRRVNTSIKQVEASRISRKLREERLRAEEEKFKVGLSTSRDVLEDQEDLILAESNVIRNITNYLKSLAQLDRVVGRTLERYSIEVR